MSFARVTKLGFDFCHFTAVFLFCHRQIPLNSCLYPRSKLHSGSYPNSSLALGNISITMLDISWPICPKYRLNIFTQNHRYQNHTAWYTVPRALHRRPWSKHKEKAINLPDPLRKYPMISIYRWAGYILAPIPRIVFKHAMLDISNPIHICKHVSSVKLYEYLISW